jgi:hypothetical protein
MLLLPGISGAQGDATDQTATGVYPPWGFGGYVWLGDVSEVGANWSVPIVDATSKQSDASTWIGVQPEAGGAPFIQVGTLEEAERPGHDHYNAFWSDSQVGFHPQLLGPVFPGDVVSAQMVQVDSGWQLTLRDLGAHRTYDITVPYGADQKLTQAEWTQEDPSPSLVTPVDLPYPKMSNVSFDDVQVNNTTPSLNLRYGQILMASGGTILVPGPFQNDEFSLLSPTGVEKQYLEDVELLTPSSARLDVAMNFWGQDSKSKRLDFAQAAAHGVSAQLDALSSLKVPPSTRQNLSSLENQLRAILADYSQWIRSGLNLYGTAYDNLQTDRQNLAWYGDRVRADLNLPPSA